MKNDCGICHRVTEKEVYNFIDKICDNAKIDNKNKFILYKETLKILQKEDKGKWFSLWCGKSKKVIIGSIVYVIGIVFSIRQKPNKKLGYSHNVLTQRCIADSLNISVPSIYNFYKKILKKYYPELL